MPPVLVMVIVVWVVLIEVAGARPGTGWSSPLPTAVVRLWVGSVNCWLSGS